MHRAAFLVGVSFLLAACAGTAPTATSGMPIVVVAPTGASTDAPAGSLAATPAPLVTALPTTEAPATTPIVTEPPVTPPPPTAAPGIGVPISVAGRQTVTVLAFEQWPGTATVKPAKGKVFKTVSIRIDGITLTPFDSVDFKLRDDGSAKVYAWRQGRAPHLYSSTGLNPGANYVGWITYEVPKAAAGPWILVYRPSFEAGASYRIPLT
jgi:hypothetical protein